MVPLGCGQGFAEASDNSLVTVLQLGQDPSDTDVAGVNIQNEASFCSSCGPGSAHYSGKDNTSSGLAPDLKSSFRIFRCSSNVLPMRISSSKYTRQVHYDSTLGMLSISLSKAAGAL